MNNLLQDCSPPSYVSADDKYLWLSYKPFFRKAWIEMLPGPFLRARRARAGIDVYSSFFITVWGGVREWGRCKDVPVYICFLGACTEPE